MAGIIVGVDGSEHSRRALSWAMREAIRRHVTLTVMTVHPNLVRPATEIYWPMPSYPENTFDMDRARTTVQEFVAKAAGEIGEAPEVNVVVANGDAAEELVRAAHDAEMLVVGSRGSGEFGRLLMGSVSSKVMHHATCAVAVIPGNR